MKKKILVVFSAVVLAVGLVGGRASAWGPERTLFTNAAPATYAVFNSITDNAAVGDERDFVRIVEVGTGNAYGNEVAVRGGKEYQVYIYYHNNASSTFNTQEKGYAGVAREVKLSSQFSTRIEAGSKGTVSATISSSNTNPVKVWDEAYMAAEKTVTVKYKVGSAKIFNDWDSNGSVLSTNLFSSAGTYLGLNELNGIILGCDEYSGQVVYTLVVTEEEEPEPTSIPDNPEPEPVPTPDEPESTPETEPEPTTPEDVPDELPNTGPAEIALAGFIVLGLTAWGIYYFRTKKNLKRVKASVMGDDDGKNIS